MKLTKKLYAYGVIGVLILATGCTNSGIEKQSVNIAQEIDSEKININKEAAYKSRLFDTSYVHSINIEMNEEDWNDLLENASEKGYYSCNITIDGEEYSNVGIKTKGNSSLSQVVNSDSDRYSFKIKFDKYNKEQDYYGLEKLNLNNIIQDTTYMKDYLAYTMMGSFGVASPYVSYSYITINGQEWGLYLNVEDIGESFLERNYGEDYGALYKPETMEMNGDRGGQMPQDMKPEDFPEGFEPGNMMTVPREENQEEMKQVDDNGMQRGPAHKGGFGRPGNENSLGADLKYTDDQYESYANIFDYAETDITDDDKDRLIASIKQLNEGTNLDEVLDIEAVLRYFVVHNFVDNYDSYTGTMLHNYYLYEQNGKLTLLPWDYNLAFGAFGDMGNKNDRGNMLPPGQLEEQNLDNTQNQETNLISQDEKAKDIDKGQLMKQGMDATSMVNMAIDTPLSGTDEEDRPLWSQLINNESYKAKYHELFDAFLKEQIESNEIQDEINRIAEMISPYVQKDPTAFYTYEEFTKGVETIKTFISLRGESIRKQLTGDIPSTTEEQNTFMGEVVDASSINLSDMGSNHMGNSLKNNETKIPKQ